MSDVIGFLERAGQDAQLRHASHMDMELAMAGAQIEPELRSAILAPTPSQLESLLGCEPMLCMQFPSKEDEEESEEDDTEEAPAREGEEMTLQSCSVAQLR